MNRPRGFIQDWKPRPATGALLEQVAGIITAYREHLPLTIRQIFYRLVSRYGYPKTERAYQALGELLSKARRAGHINMAAIRDDGFTLEKWQGYQDAGDWIDTVRNDAAGLRFDRQQGQPVHLVLWSEAAGMVPQIESIAIPYSIPVASSGGFDSLTAKHETAKWLAQISPVTVLHIGDHDPSGCHMFSSLAEDMGAFAKGYDGEVEFIRLAVTPEQIEALDLPTAPAKATDRRSFTGETTQAEAIDPADLAGIIEAAIVNRIDGDIYESRLVEESQARADLAGAVSEIAGRYLDQINSREADQ